MNRLHEVRFNSTITEWNYITGSENPAGMGTRYHPLQQLHPESVWINGPSLLYQNNTKVSENEIYNLPHEFDNIESSCQNSITKQQEYQSFIKWNHYSSLDKLGKYIAALIKFKEIWLLKRQNKGKENCYKKLSVENLNKAEFEIYREAQLESFATEFDNLVTNQPITNKSKILSLTPILSENLIRVGGRVQKSDIPYYRKHQIILCKSHPLSKLIILDTNFHTGRDQTLAILREKVWIKQRKLVQLQNVMEQSLHVLQPGQST